MNFWLGSNAATFTDATIEAVEGRHNYSLIDLFYLDSGDRWMLRQAGNVHRPLQSFQRFCGWDIERQRHSGQSGQSVGLRIQTCPIEGSLLDICTQEVFVALGSRLQMPSEKEMLARSIGRAEVYRRQSEWERAETLLQWACQRHPLLNLAQDSDDDDLECERAQDIDHDDLPAEAFRAIGELYRWALAQTSDEVTRKFGRDGIRWMRDHLSSTGEGANRGTEILDCYQTIKENIDQLLPSNALPRAEVCRQLAEAINSRDRTEVLYRLCLVKPGDFRSPVLQAALPLAARYGWSEVASAMLEMKADPNSMDDNGRTALSYYAELGLDIDRYLDCGAFSDLPDREEKTPLVWAAEHGHRAIVDRLLEEGARVNFKG